MVYISEDFEGLNQGKLKDGDILIKRWSNNWKSRSVPTEMKRHN